MEHGARRHWSLEFALSKSRQSPFFAQHQEKAAEAAGEERVSLTYSAEPEAAWLPCRATRALPRLPSLGLARPARPVVQRYLTSPCRVDEHAG